MSFKKQIESLLANPIGSLSETEKELGRHLCKRTAQIILKEIDLFMDKIEEHFERGSSELLCANSIPLHIKAFIES